MKKTLALLASALISMAAFAQAPQKLSYQSVIRNASNNLVTSTPIGVRVSILQTAPTGTAIYVETHNTNTNSNGLMTIEIGGGSPVSGTFSNIDWAVGPYYVKTEIDPAGGTSYTITGTSQMLSVPYALYSKATGDTSMWNKNGSVVYRYGGVGIGTKNPSGGLHVQDTIGSSGITSILQGRNFTGFYLRTHDTLNRPYKVWVMENKTEAGIGNRFALFNNGKYPFQVKANSKTNALVVSGSGIGIGTASPMNLLHVQDTTSSAPIAALIDGRNQTSLYFRTIAGGVYKTWVMFNSRTSSVVPDAFTISSANQSLWTDYVFTIRMGAPSYSFYMNSIGNLGLGTSTPNSKLSVSGGDVNILDIGSGIIMKSPNGSCWRVTVDNSGNLVSTAITCP